MLESILSYDYHPIVVHIPVAFLSIYTLFEILSALIQRLNNKTVFYIKSFLLFVGIVGVGGALATGEVASHLNRDSIPRAILNAHEEWAEFTAGFFWLPLIIYIILMLSYERSYIEAKLISWFGQKNIVNTIFNYLIKITYFFEKNRWILAVVALIGLVSVSVTGALGGAMVYGPDADPFIETVISILGL